MSERYAELREAQLWPWLSNVIRKADGNHDLGAGELAARIAAELEPRVAALLAERDALHAALGQLRAAAQAVQDEWDELGPTATQSTLDSHRRLREILARIREES